ncbi:MAG: chemotaxis protein CheA [Archangium sp.]|nr:chemotaxis protein CheA [Archangium sp.]
MNSTPSDAQEALRQTFLEDARENLAVAEKYLLAMDAGPLSADEIASLFRAIHSIKGSAGSFGFAAVTESAHGLESYLDQVRSGQRQPNHEAVAVLLRGVDLLKRLVEAPEEPLQQERAELEAALARLDEVAGPPWRFTFSPPQGLLAVGPDPIKLLAGLRELGDVQLTCDTSRLPTLGTFEPLTSYLSWTAIIPGSVAKERIEALFDWVDGGWALTRQEPVVEGPAASAPVPGASAPAPAPDFVAQTIRVPVDKLDQLMNMVGELVITQSMLGEVDPARPLAQARIAKISEGLSQLARNTRHLQESVMRLRSQPLSIVFGRLPRTVHALCDQLGKRVNLQVTGDGTELDKTVVEKLGDPLVHLVRNCVDHGIEAPAERLAAGKPEAGTLSISSFARGKDVYIEIQDDGRGLDEQAILAKAKDRGLVEPEAELSSAAIAQLIFLPGLSTAKEITDVSGRGVGMDVVRQNVRSLGGEITITSVPQKGTKFTLRLPLTLAIMEGQLVRIGRRLYVIPLLSIVESIQPDWSLLQPCGHQQGYRMRGELIPVVDLPARLERLTGDNRHCLMVVVETDRGRVGLLVNELLSQQQVVVKSLEANYGAVDGLAGATILGDGSVSLILEPNALHDAEQLAA